MPGPPRRDRASRRQDCQQPLATPPPYRKVRGVRWSVGYWSVVEPTVSETGGPLKYVTLLMVVEGLGGSLSGILPLPIWVHGLVVEAATSPKTWTRLPWVNRLSHSLSGNEPIHSVS